LPRILDSVFERFTERARQVVVLAQEEARALGHNYIGTEHVLLGLLREEEGIAARALQALDVTLPDVRGQVARIVGQGDEAPTGQIPFTPRAKKVLELSLREALGLGHNHIGTEHILLGLARENDGVAARILLDFDADAEKIHNEVIRIISGGASPPFVPESPPVAPEVVAEIDRLRREKAEAAEAEDWDRAAALRERERRFLIAARQLTRAWQDEPEPAPSIHATATPAPVVTQGITPPELQEPRRRTWPADALLAGWVLFGVASALGLLVGWLIWG
jgi:ATP-dependent Clp protease ATP-binding subunit ClpA